MRSEKSKNTAKTVATFRWLVILVAITFMAWFALGLIPATTNAEKNPGPKIDIPKLTESINAVSVRLQYQSVPVDMKKLEREGEQKAQEHAQMVRTVQTNNPSVVQDGEYIMGSDADIDLMELQRAKWAYIISAIETIKAQEEAKQRRDDMIARIDGYLHNCHSPMEGLGWAFYDSAARYGIEPRLSVAISQAESSAGLCCFAPHNAWGMLAFRGGFSDWVEGINANNDWLHNYFGSPQTAYDCPGYCEPSHPWMENVQGVLDSI